MTVRVELERQAGDRTGFKYYMDGRPCAKSRVALLGDHFNLQVENPCVVLTQQVHATFLRGAKGDHARYAFFSLCAGIAPLREICSTRTRR